MPTVTCNKCKNAIFYIELRTYSTDRGCFCNKRHWKNLHPRDPELDTVIECPDFEPIPIPDSGQAAVPK